MPLFILGLLLLIGLLAYSIVRYLGSEEIDDRPVRERYPHAFPVHREPGSEEEREEPPVDSESYVDEDSLRGDIDHVIRNIREEIRSRVKESDIDFGGLKEMFGFGGKSDDDNTVEFPTDNIENEKRKRGINSDD
ncbi:MAG: hypothetical protein IKI38_03465 [Mogibacterium sp.]|nr:hypothetical protein [Mogibacterium sp.]